MAVESMSRTRIRGAITAVRWDGSITLPYWLFKKGGLLHGRRQVVLQVRDGALVMEPVTVVWVKAPRKPVKVVIHEAADGTLWAEVSLVPGLRVAATTVDEIRAQVRAAITAA